VGKMFAGEPCVFWGAGLFQSFKMFECSCLNDQECCVSCVITLCVCVCVCVCVQGRQTSEGKGWGHARR